MAGVEAAYSPAIAMKRSNQLSYSVPIWSQVSTVVTEFRLSHDISHQQKYNIVELKIRGVVITRD